MRDFWGGMALIVIDILIGGYVFMLGVGFIHGEWIHQLPTLGYWQAVVIVGITRCLRVTREVRSE